MVPMGGEKIYRSVQGYRSEPGAAEHWCKYTYVASKYLYFSRYFLY